MSVKELNIVTNVATLKFRRGTATDKFGIQITDSRASAVMMLDRNQADMLRLYLSEQLQSAISKALDDAIIDELANGPKSILGNGHPE